MDATSEVSGRMALTYRLSIHSGLLVFAVSLILYSVLQLIDPVMQYTNLGVRLLFLITMISLLTGVGLDIRKKIGGDWPFSEAFKSMIIIITFVAFVPAIFNYILFKYVDPQLPDKISTTMYEAIIAKLTRANVSKGKIDHYTEMFRNGRIQASFAPTFRNMMVILVCSFLFYSFVAAVIAFCIKKMPPVIINEEKE